MVEHIYEIPETLKIILALKDQLLVEANINLEDYLGFHVRFNDRFRYACTPEDAIIFAWTGADGDHFAFDTKNGTIENLEEAPILFIQPMDFSNEVKRAANNIRDFLSIYLEIKDLYVIERIGTYRSESNFIHAYKQEFDLREKKDDFRLIEDRIRNSIQLKSIESLYKYLLDLRGNGG